MIEDSYLFILRSRILGILFLVLVSGCAAVPPVSHSSPSAVANADILPAVVLPIMRAEYPPSLTNADISVAIVSILQRYGFSVVSTSPETGMVETDWWTATTADEKFPNTVVSGVPSGSEENSAQAHKERIKLVFSVDRTDSVITIQPYKEQRSGESDWSDIKLDNGDMLLVHNIVTVAVLNMGGSVDSLQWIYSLDNEPAQRRKPQEERDGFGNNARKIALFSAVAIAVAIVMLSGW